MHSCRLKTEQAVCADANNNILSEDFGVLVYLGSSTLSALAFAANIAIIAYVCAHTLLSYML